MRVRELGRDVARDYDGREPLLVAPLKASPKVCQRLVPSAPARTR